MRAVSRTAGKASLPGGVDTFQADLTDSATLTSDLFDDVDRIFALAVDLHHRAAEFAISSRTDKWTMLRPGSFANNLLSWAWPVRSGAPIRAPYIRSAQDPIHERDVATWPQWC